MRNLLHRPTLSLLVMGVAFLGIPNLAAEEGYGLRVRYSWTLREAIEEGGGERGFSGEEIREAFLDGGEFDPSEAEGIVYFSNESEVRDTSPFEEGEDAGSSLERSGGAGGPGGGGMADRGAGGPGGSRMTDKGEPRPGYPAGGPGGGGGRGEFRFVLLYPADGEGRTWVIAVPISDQ